MATPSRPDPVSARFRNVLLLTDFSEASAKALPYAAAVARRLRSKLYVFHAITAERGANVSAVELDTILSEQQREAEKQIAALLKRSHFSGIDYEVVLARGDLWRTLSVVAAERDIDLLVAGTSGKLGIRKLLTGSAAEEILRMVAHPVLLVGPKVSVTPETEVHLERILCFVDFLPESKRAMEYSYALAKEAGAQLSFLHAAGGEWTEVSARMTAKAYFHLRLAEKGWLWKDDATEPEFLVESGSPENLILECVNREQIQLVVLGVPETGHPDLSAHLPGPLAYNLVSRAPCPVLAVRGAPEERDGGGVEATPKAQGAA